MVSATVLAEQTLNGLTIGMVFVLLAAGLSIIFGVMDVINFAHGELFALGAYFAFAIAGATGGAGTGFWVALVVAPLCIGLLGGAIERLTIRPLYGRNPLYHILLTFGLVLIVKDVIEYVWGRESLNFPPPPSLADPVTVLGFEYSAYNYFVVGVGGVVALGTWLALTRTRYGLVVRAGAQDREMVRNLGIDIDAYYTLVFAYGAVLAAIAGIVLAGRRSVAPAMGDTVIIPAFVIVVLGGLGSFRGAVVGGLGVGLVQTFARSYVPQLEGLIVFLLMILVLLVRPQGLFGDPEWQNSGDGGDLLTGGGEGLLGPRLRSSLGVGLVGVLLVAPLGIGVAYTSYEVNFVLLNVFTWALFALSLDFVMGYAGLVSLGHVLFYGLGAYGAVLTVLHVTPSLWVALAVGAVVAAAVAWVVGYLSIRVTGVYFAMITLGFAELFHQATFKVGFTNGDEGLFQGVDPVYGLAAGSPAVGDVALYGEIELYYYVALGTVVGSYLLARRLMHAPFGSVLQSIRESEQRAAFLGYDVTAYKRRAFVVSGGLAGVAGGLAAFLTGGVAPTFLEWIKSGQVIVMTILGGMGTLYGPMVGAGVFFGVKEQLITYTQQWQGVLGLLFVLFVIYVPRGLVSLPAQLAALARTGGEGGEAAPAEPDAGPEGSD